jgi:hypothetical protein
MQSADQCAACLASDVAATASKTPKIHDNLCEKKELSHARANKMDD